MKFSFWINNANPWDDMLATAMHADKTGWHGIWVADHFMSNDEAAAGPMHEAWSAIAGFSAVTTQARLGVLVSGNTYRHPAVLAKAVATIDHINNGRTVLGIGAGWQQNEHEKYGIELPPVKARLDRFEEACEVITGLLRNERTTFSGEYYQLDDAPLEPKPVNRVPILVGGGGEKRTMRIAAQYADEWNVWGTPEVLRHKNQVLNGHCEAIDRDPATITRSAQGLLFLFDNAEESAKMRARDLGRPMLVGTPAELVDVVGSYSDSGVDELIIPDFTLPQGAAKLEVLDTLMEEVFPAFA